MCWTKGLMVFAIVEFFKDSNDCKQNANSLWAGMVVVIVEGMLALFLLRVFF